MTTFERARAKAERQHATKRLFCRYAVRDWWPREAQAHPAPDPALPADDARQDLVVVAGAAALLVVIAAVAQALNPLVTP